MQLWTTTQFASGHSIPNSIDWKLKRQHNNIRNGRSRRTKREIHTNIGKTDRYKFDIPDC